MFCLDPDPGDHSDHANSKCQYQQQFEDIVGLIGTEGGKYGAAEKGAEYHNNRTDRNAAYAGIFPERFEGNPFWQSIPLRAMQEGTRARIKLEG